MKKLIAAAGIGAALTIAPLAVAGTANAYHTHNITSVVNWGGADCIVIEGPRIPSPATLGTASFCGGSSSANYNIPAGGLGGANPVMGHASWISCATYIDGSLYETDFASAGDGHDANCLWRIA